MTTPDDRASRVLLRAARLLLTYNLRTRHLRERLVALASALGLPAEVSLAYRSVTLYLADGRQLHAQAPELRINVAVAMRVLQIVEALCARSMNIDEALQALDGVEASVGRHSRPLLALLFGLGAAALAALLSGDLACMLITGLSSASGLLVRQEMVKRHMLHFSMPFVAALLGALLGGLMIRSGFTQTPGVCLIVPALMLVPGPHLINGLYDLLENNIQNGIARLGLACAILAAAAMGTFLGGWITLGMSTVPVWVGTAQPVPLWLDVMLAGMAACAFGAFYNAPWRILWISILCGMVGHGIRYVSLANGISLEIATLSACGAIGLIAGPAASRLRLPFAAVAFAGAVPMMPGVQMFQAIAGAMDMASVGAASPAALVAGTLGGIFKSAFVVGAMGLGLLLGARLPEFVNGRERSAADD